MLLHGERVSLRPLDRADLDRVEAWTPFTNPLFAPWNRFPWQGLGKDIWHALESTDPALLRLAILNEPGQVIGIIGLLGVGEGGSPLLSIFMGADFVGQGLGTDALRTLLRYLFTERRCASLRLSVAATNPRARRAYEHCGFRITGRRFRPIEEDDALPLLNDPRYRHLRTYFRRRNGLLYLLHYDMEVRAGQCPI